jgi:hypothetical protein
VSGVATKSASTHASTSIGSDLPFSGTVPRDSSGIGRVSAVRVSQVMRRSSPVSRVGDRDDRRDEEHGRRRPGQIQDDGYERDERQRRDRPDTEGVGAEAPHREVRRRIPGGNRLVGAPRGFAVLPCNDSLEVVAAEPPVDPSRETVEHTDP